MMFDKETGRSKGYAFVEYPDVETASSAVRNLNNYSIGNRQLKCDFSREGTMSSAGGATKGKAEDSLPPLPLGSSLQPGETYAQAISRVINSLDQSRVQQIVTDVTKMSLRNPVLMENLLAQCPQLSYAIVEAILQTKKVDPSAIQNILLNQPTQEDHQPTQEPQPQHQDHQPQEAQEEQLNAEQLELIKQVVEIPDEDVAALPEDQRASILQIKENYKNGVYGNL